MAFWSDKYWGTDYWGDDYWSIAGGAPPEVHVQYPNVELVIGPAGTQSWAVTHTQTADPLFTVAMAALQDYIGGDFTQTADVVFTFAPAGTQTVTNLTYSQSTDVVVTFDFVALQYLGISQSTDVVVTFDFTAVQTVGSSTLTHEQVSNPTLVLDPTVMQVYLEPFAGPEALATFNTVDGYPSLQSTGVLSPAQNIGSQQFFEFLVYSQDYGWLNNAGPLNQPVFLDVKFGNSDVISVSVEKSRFIVDYSMGAIYTTVRDGLVAKNLNITLSGYEKFDGYCLGTNLERPTSVLVRAYEERRVVQ